MGQRKEEIGRACGGAKYSTLSVAAASAQGLYYPMRTGVCSVIGEERQSTVMVLLLP